MLLSLAIDEGSPLKTHRTGVFLSEWTKLGACVVSNDEVGWIAVINYGADSLSSITIENIIKAEGFEP